MIKKQSLNIILYTGIRFFILYPYRLAQERGILGKVQFWAVSRWILYILFLVYKLICHRINTGCLNKPKITHNGVFDLLLLDDGLLQEIKLGVHRNKFIWTVKSGDII